MFRGEIWEHRHAKEAQIRSSICTRRRRRCCSLRVQKGELASRLLDGLSAQLVELFERIERRSGIKSRS
jgi:hypothetical protein